MTATVPQQGAPAAGTPSTDQPAPATGGIPAAFNGTWTGSATNEVAVTFQLTATFQTGATTAPVAYAPPACGVMGL